MEIKKLGELKEVEVAGSKMKVVAGKKIHVSHHKIPGNLSFEQHGHPGEGIGYMLKGELEVYTNISPEKVIVNAGDFMVLQPSEKIGGRNPCHEEAEFLCIEMK